VEVEVIRVTRAWPAVLLLLPAVLLVPRTTGGAAELQLGPRRELTHPGKGHEVHASAPALAVTSDGTPLVTWATEEGQDKHVYVARLGDAAAKPVRVNPSTLGVESLHHSPLLAVGPRGEIYLSWSSDRPKPDGVLFASDLRLSRSLDGGHTWEGHLRVNEDRPTSHSFEGMTVTSEGTVVMAWIDSREGPERAATWVARVLDRGTRAEPSVKLDGDTCVCCRVGVRGGPGDAVAVLWRKVFPGDIRDMVLGLSRDGGKSFETPARVAEDSWKITACPHRGGQVAMDGKGKVYAAWYTEGKRGVPSMLLATSTDGRRFGAPIRVNPSTATIPDQVRLAVNAAGQAVVVWEDATAVRRRILLRASLDGGRTLGPVQTLSKAVKAYAPDVAVTPAGDFVVAWHEEQFPSLKTVVQPLRVTR
jgi:hypothetical protein